MGTGYNAQAQPTTQRSDLAPANNPKSRRLHVGFFLASRTIADLEGEAGDAIAQFGREIVGVMR